MNFEDETNETKFLLDEEAIKALEESPTSFWLRGPNARLSQNGQPDEEPAIQTQGKGKKKMPEYDIVQGRDGSRRF